MKNDICYPWDISTILGGLSLTATYVSHKEYEIVDDIKSQYVLSVLRENQCNPNLTFKDIFEYSDNNKPLLVYPHKNFGYLKHSLIHFDIYNSMVDFHKEKDMRKIKPRFDHYINFRDNFKIDDSLFEDEKKLNKHREYRSEFHAGSLKEYASDLFSKYGRHPFADIKINYGLNDEETLNILLDDMVIMDIFFECSILISPKPLNDDHSSVSLKRELFKQSHEYLYNNKNYSFFKTKYNIKIEQEIKISDIKKSFERDVYKKEMDEILKFEIENNGKEEVIIYPECIKNFIFLNNYMDDSNIAIKIILE